MRVCQCVHKVLTMLVASCPEGSALPAEASKQIGLGWPALFFDVNRSLCRATRVLNYLRTAGHSNQAWLAANGLPAMTGIGEVPPGADDATERQA